MTHVHPENPHAGQGAVLLDIGGDVGAVVVTMPPELVGQEVEIWPAGTHVPAPPHEHSHDHAHDEHRHDHVHPPHVAVVNRPVADGQVASLVFPEVQAGGYELAAKGGGPVRLRVQVEGGAVTAAAWPAEGDDQPA